MRGPKEPSGPQERRDQLENQVCQECRELTAHPVTLEKRGLMERKDTWVRPALKDPSVIPAPEA